MLLREEARGDKGSRGKAQRNSAAQNSMGGIVWKMGMLVEAELEGRKSCKANHGRCYGFRTVVKASNGLAEIGPNLKIFHINEGENCLSECRSSEILWN